MSSSGSVCSLIQRWNTGTKASGWTARADSGVTKIFSCSFAASMATPPPGRGQLDGPVGHDPAGALALAQVGDGVLARIAPVAVEAGILLVRGQLLRLLDVGADGLLADAAHERGHGLVLEPLVRVLGGDLL